MACWFAGNEFETPENSKRLKIKRREEEGRESFLSHKVETFLVAVAKLEPRLEAMEKILLTESSLHKFVDFLQSCGGAYNNYLSFWIESANVLSDSLSDEQLYMIAKSIFATYVPLKAPLYILLSAIYKDKLYKALGLKKVMGKSREVKETDGKSLRHVEKDEKSRSSKNMKDERSDKSATTGRRASNMNKPPPVMLHARNINYAKSSTRLPSYLQQVPGYVPVREDIVTVFKLVRGEVLKAFADTTYEKFFSNRCYTTWRSQKRAHIYAFVWNYVIQRSKAFNYDYETADVRVGDRKRYEVMMIEKYQKEESGDNKMLHLIGRDADCAGGTTDMLFAPSRLKSVVAAQAQVNIKRSASDVGDGTSATNLESNVTIAVSVSLSRSFPTTQSAITSGVSAAEDNKLTEKGSRHSGSRPRLKRENSLCITRDDDVTMSNQYNYYMERPPLSINKDCEAADMCSIIPVEVLSDLVYYGGQWLIICLASLENSKLAVSLHKAKEHDASSSASPPVVGRNGFGMPFVYANKALEILVGGNFDRRQVIGKSMDCLYSVDGNKRPVSFKTCDIKNRWGPSQRSDSSDAPAGAYAIHATSAPEPNLRTCNDSNETSLSDIDKAFGLLQNGVMSTFSVELSQEVDANIEDSKCVENESVRVVQVVKPIVSYDNRTILYYISIYSEIYENERNPADPVTTAEFLESLMHLIPDRLRNGEVSDSIFLDPVRNVSDLKIDNLKIGGKNDTRVYPKC